MAQRISRAKRTVADVRVEEPGDLATVLRMLYLVFNEGYTGDVDLATEAIRLTRQLASMTDDEQTAGLLALMLLHHVGDRRGPGAAAAWSPWPSRTAPAGTPRSSLRASQSCRQRWVATDSGSSKHRPLSRTPTRRAPRRPTGCRSSAGTTSCSGSPRARSCSSTGPSRSAEADGPVAGLAALATVDSGPASPPRRLGVPPREGGRPSDRSTAVCRCRPVRLQPRRTSPSQPAGSADQSSAAWVSLVGRRFGSGSSH